MRDANFAGAGKYIVRKGILVDLVGIEPTTSSMPYYNRFGDCQVPVNTWKNVLGGKRLG